MEWTNAETFPNLILADFLILLRRKFMLNTGWCFKSK